MRELKFRAWDGEKYWHNIAPSPLPSPTLDICKKITDYEPEYYNMVDIIEGVEAIEQYTGLIDNNGEEMYEGDILEFTTVKLEYVKKARRGIVVFHEGTFCVYDNVYVALGRINNPRWHRCVVVGNMHENPELLGGGEE